MEILLECDSNLNRANFYERMANIALKNFSNYIYLVKKSYMEAIFGLRNAIRFLDAATRELDRMKDESILYDLRIAELQRQLDLLHPFQFLDCFSTIHSTRREGSSSHSTSSAHEESDWIVYLPADASNSLNRKDKKCPKTCEQHIEEAIIRQDELTKLVDILSIQLAEAQKQAAEERSRRLTAEAECISSRFCAEATLNLSFQISSKGEIPNIALDHPLKVLSSEVPALVIPTTLANPVEFPDSDMYT